MLELINGKCDIIFLRGYMLTEQQAIQKVNKFISQSGLGHEYRVYKLREAAWGWIMYWLPQDPHLRLQGSSPYLCHRNGYVKEANDVAFRHNMNITNPDVITAFVKDAENSYK